MHIQFNGRRALVTGSTGGIGFAIAKGLLAAGAEVVVNGRSEASVAAALARLQDLPGRAIGFAGDLATEADSARLFAAHPDVDIVVNNLGIFGPQDFFDTPDSEWERFFQTNVMSGVRMARHYAQGMVARGWGRIVFISSESAINIPADMVHYGFSKTAQLAVSRGLAKRLAGTGVTVNAVLPGPTFTDGLEQMLKDATAKSGRSARDEADVFVRNARPTSIIQRAANVDEVANLVAYIASPLSSATTGAALRVDGGVVDSMAI